MSPPQWREEGLPVVGFRCCERPQVSTEDHSCFRSGNRERLGDVVRAAARSLGAMTDKDNGPLNLGNIMSLQKKIGQFLREEDRKRRVGK